MKISKSSTVCTSVTIIGVLSFTYYMSFQNVTENNENVTVNSLKMEEIENKTEMNIIKIANVDCLPLTSKLNTAKVKATDPELIQLIRDCYIEGPSELPYALTHPEKREPSQGQAAFVDSTLNQMEYAQNYYFKIDKDDNVQEGGFYVDCGAHKGEEFSNSLFFERYRNWNGILIEASPLMYNQLKMKNRKAFTLNACLNSNPYPSVVTFLEKSWVGRIVPKISHSGEYVQVQCFPLQSILLALNQTKVDYFSLDVEGSEAGVLESIPWDKLDINMMSIEYDKWPGGKESLKAYMQGKGYKTLTEIKGMAVADIVVIKEEPKYL